MVVTSTALEGVAGRVPTAPEEVRARRAEALLRRWGVAQVIEAATVSRRATATGAGRERAGGPVEAPHRPRWPARS
jgi:hypothetical protein